MERHLESLRQETVRAGANYLVLRLRRTRNPDVVAIEHLEHFLRVAEKGGVTVLLADGRPDLAKILHNARFGDWLAADRIYKEEDEKYSATLRAVCHAYGLRRQHGPDRTETEAAYYLVS